MRVVYMRRLTSLVVIAVLTPTVPRADGLSAIELQSLLRSSPNSGANVALWQNADLSLNHIMVGGQEISLGSIGTQQSSLTSAIQALAKTTVQTTGGDVSQTKVLTSTGTLSQTLSSKIGEHVSVSDFGAVGGATTYYLASAGNIGDSAISILGSVPIKIGQIVDGFGIGIGTTVTSLLHQSSNQSGTGAITVVGLSAPLLASNPAGSRFDFAVQDDYPAFLRAQASGARYIEVPPGPTREYYLSNYAGNLPGVVWKLDGAFFAQNGGIVEGVNQSMTQDLNSEALLNSMQSARGEDTLLVTAANQPTSSAASYQKNVVHVQLNQGDPSSYSFLGDSGTVVRDIVGYSVQGHCPTGNTKCSMFGSEAAMTMDPSSDGSITGYEISIGNFSGRANIEMGSWNNKSGMTLLSSGNTMSAAMWISGGAWQTGIDISTSVLGKAWAVRTEGTRGIAGLATTHSDYAYVDHAGSLFAQSAHIGGGATTGDTDPLGGVSISNDPGGRLSIGSAVLSTSSQPTLEFHYGVGATTDAYTSRFVQTPVGLQLQTSGGSPSATSHPDGSTEFSGPVVQTHATGLAIISTPLTLTAHFNTITLCPSGGIAMLFSRTPIGGDIYVLNRCGSPFSIVAPPGSVIENNAVDAPITIAANTTQHYYLESAMQWRQLQ